ncbi:N-acetylmuramoyl-L-alanine amidase [Solibacillus sp. FSL W8-0372]|uniref:N-acetylmuramoyl-L-alanine amidase family protein n=1 Tax=Solibacillus sp. FSL W8-0372 TaxID=2921713 RepID=UPI0030D034AC
MSKKLKIFIDPGHGGHDPGAIGAKSIEAENVLKVALALEKKLKAQGHQVKLSRRTDTYLTLKQRADLADAWGADIFISLHDNSAVNKTATGFETFIYNGENVSTNSIKLQQHVHKAIINGIGLRDRGLKRANFAVLRLTSMPALLIEYGFISNIEDEKIIAFEIDKQAQLTFKGINSYLGVKAKPITSTPTLKPEQTTDLKEESGEIMLTETGRNEIRDLLKKARKLTFTVNGKSEPLINPTVHTDAKINQYTDKQLLSYQAAIINRTF